MCGYDLLGLPREHKCPECEFAYRPDMFSVPVWKSGEAPRVWIVVFWVLFSAMFGTPLILAVFWGGIGRLPWFTLVIFSLLALIGLQGLVEGIIKLQLKKNGRSNLTLLCSNRGVGLIESNGHWKWFDWATLTRLSVRRTITGYWRVRARQSRWFRWLRPNLNVVFRGSRREAEILRNHMRKLFEIARTPPRTV